MLIEFFFDKNGYVSGFRHGWNPNLAPCPCIHGLVCNGLGVHPPKKENVYFIHDREFPILESYVLCRNGIKITNGKKQYDVSLGHNLYLTSDDDQNQHNYQLTRKLLTQQ